MPCKGWHYIKFLCTRKLLFLLKLQCQSILCQKYFWRFNIAHHSGREVMLYKDNTSKPISKIISQPYLFFLMCVPSYEFIPNLHLSYSIFATLLFSFKLNVIIIFLLLPFKKILSSRGEHTSLSTRFNPPQLSKCSFPSCTPKSKTYPCFSINP